MYTPRNDHTKLSILIIICSLWLLAIFRDAQIVYSFTYAQPSDYNYFDTRINIYMEFYLIYKYALIEYVDLFVK